MNCSHQFPIVSSHSFVTSNRNWYSSIGGNNICLHCRSDSLVCNFMCSWYNSRVNILDSRSHYTMDTGICNSMMGVSIRDTKIIINSINQGFHHRGIDSLNSLPLSIAIYRDSYLVFINNRFSNCVSNHSTGSNCQRSHTGIINLFIQCRGSKNSRNFMNCSLQSSIISGNSFVTTNRNWNSSICGLNLRLHCGGVSLVGNFMCCWYNSSVNILDSRSNYTMDTSICNSMMGDTSICNSMMGDTSPN